MAEAEILTADQGRLSARSAARLAAAALAGAGRRYRSPLGVGADRGQRQRRINPGHGPVIRARPLRLSAGDVDVTFSAPPATITAAAAVGSVTLRQPRNVPYAVNATATVGTIQVSVTRNPASPHVITAATRTGSITIQPAP
jgi:hypothetical protein